MNSFVPWWAKIGAKLALSRLPLGYALWRRIGLFRHGAMNVGEYAIGVFNSHSERAGIASNLAGKSILELGPGDSVFTAIIAAAHGAQASLVDTGSYVDADIQPCLRLAAKLASAGLKPPDFTGCRTITDILVASNASYRTSGLQSLASIPDESIDLIFSQAVLEHVRKHEFLATMQECRRILKSGGMFSNQVDLRDHLGGALNNLRFREQTWESNGFARSGFYTNRIRYSAMLSFFQQAGLHVVATNVRRWPSLPTPRCKLAPEFRDLSSDELCVSGFDVLLQKV